MNQVKSVRIQGTNHLPCLCPGDLCEEIVKLDAKLLNRNASRETAFQHLVFETFNINLQQIDGMVMVSLHLMRKAGALYCLAPACLQPCAVIGPTPNREVPNGGRRQTY